MESTIDGTPMEPIHRNRERAASSIRVLVINPGSTSTKLALFAGAEEVASQSVSHSTEELARFESLADQAPFRREAIDGFLAENRIDLVALSAVVARGGLLRPVAGGVYVVSDAMVDDLRSGRYGVHASNLGGVLARAVADPLGKPAFVADPVVVDELDEISRLSGHPELPRRSVFHALNQKSAAREACRRRGLSYDSARLIVAHLGGGISVGAHRDGRVVDVNNALDGEGPFSPERAGTLPAGQLVDLALSGSRSHEEMRRMITGGGGLVAHCGTNDLRSLVDAADSGNEKSATVLESMCFQIAKAIAAHGATHAGAVDTIVLTGGMANEEAVVGRIRDRVSYLAPIEVIPGEREMIALAAAAVGALTGERETQRYE